MCAPVPQTPRCQSLLSYPCGSALAIGLCTPPLQAGARRPQEPRGDAEGDADQAGLGSLDSFKSRTALVHCTQEH